MCHVGNPLYPGSIDSHGRMVLGHASNPKVPYKTSIMPMMQCSVSTVRPFGAFSPHQAGTRRPAHTAARVLCTATPPVNRGGGR